MGDKAKDAEIHVRVDQRGRAAIDDKRREGESRAAWVRRAIAFAHVHMADSWQRKGDPIARLEVAHDCPTGRGDGRGVDLRTERFTDAP
jgi:hypothetical protein